LGVYPASRSNQIEAAAAGIAVDASPIEHLSGSAD